MFIIMSYDAVGFSGNAPWLPWVIKLETIFEICCVFICCTVILFAGRSSTFRVEAWRFDRISVIGAAPF
jgi:hypothetical protein